MKDIKIRIKEAARKANSCDRFVEDTEELMENLETLVYHREIEEIYVARKDHGEGWINAITIIFNGKKEGLMIINLDWLNHVQFIELNNLQWED